MLPAVMVAALAATGAWIQLHVHVNHDVAWVVHSAGWLLEGARFGTDIIAANPPLIWWLSIPAAWLSRVSGIPDANTIRFLVWLACLASIVVSHRVMAPWHRSGRATEVAAITVSLAFVLLVLPGDIFAQREHISLALVTPYVLLAALSAANRGEHTQSWLAALAGVMAGIGIALKPHFLLVPLLTEAVVFAATRQWKSSLRLETLLIAAVIAGYLALVVILTPEYLNQVLPMYRKIYWAFENMSLANLLGNLLAAALLTATAIGLALATRTMTTAHVMLATVVVAYAIAYLLQRKGYEYHRFPALAAAIVLLTLSAATAAKSLIRRSCPERMSTRVIGACTIITLWLVGVWPGIEHLRTWYQAANTTDGPIGLRETDLIQTVGSLIQHPGEYVYAFSTHPYPGFPTLNYLPARWGARSNSQFAIPAIVKEMQGSRGDKESEMAAAIALARDIVLEDFVQRRPRVLLVDTGRRKHAIGRRRFDFMKFFSGEPRLAAILARYCEIKHISNIRILVRSDSECR